MEKTLQWAAARLARMLGFHDAGDAMEMARYIISIGDEADLLQYVLDLVDEGTTDVDKFVKELITRRDRALKPEEIQTVPKPTKIFVDDSSTHSASATIDKDRNLDATPVSPSSESQFKKQSVALSNVEKPGENEPLKRTTPTIALRRQPQEIAPPIKKSKTKYVNFMDLDKGQLVSDLLPGRRRCDCNTTTHKLINNCLQCGRIVCEQEGIGPCMYCGALVVTREQQDLLSRNSNQARKFLDKLMRETKVTGISAEAFRKSGIQSCDETTAVDLATANDRRDRLVYFDRNSAQRTHVIDDEADYFDADGNKWLTREERDRMREQEDRLRLAKVEGRKNRKYTLDFAGRRVIEEEPTVVDVYHTAEEEHRLKREKDLSFPSVRQRVRELPEAEEEVTLMDGLKDNPMFKNSGLVQFDKSKVTLLPSKEPKYCVPRMRLQDKELIEMSDGGYCMSMHQPWASLLVYGIKQHEGRVWSSAHRGRLWIAAASKIPTQEEIAEIEEPYKDIYQGCSIPFPQEYPTACLLGFIDVDDVMSQEAYRTRFPNGESHMPYVFVCKNAHVLLVKYPVKVSEYSKFNSLTKGQHKIWKLEKSMHESAKKCARKVDTTWRNGITME